VLSNKGNSLSGICLLLALIVSGCDHGRTEAAYPDDADLAGHWEIELRRTRFLVPIGYARGTMELVREPIDADDCREGDSTMCRTKAGGRHTIATSGFLGYAIADTAAGMITGEGNVILILGDCCHRGEISMLGEIANGAAHGRWRASIGHAQFQKGTFKMHRREGDAD
jgi:hypothetical protein